MKGLLNFAHPPKPQLLSTDVNTVLETVAVLVLKERSRDRTSAPFIWSAISRRTFPRSWPTPCS